MTENRPPEADTPLTPQQLDEARALLGQQPGALAYTTHATGYMAYDPRISVVREIVTLFPALLAEHERLTRELAEARLLLDAWEAAGNTIARHIPEHYDSDGALVSIVEEWAKHAATVVQRAHHWRKVPNDGTAAALDAAVEVIYPSGEYL